MTRSIPARPELTLVVASLVVAIGAPSAGQFTTVINVPPDPAPPGIGSDTQLNLTARGVIPSTFAQRFQAGSPDGSSSNIEVNITGGTVGDHFTANAGVTVNVGGGSLGDLFTVTGGSRLVVTAGQFSSDLTILDGSSLDFRGGDGGDFLGVGGASSAAFSGGSVNAVFADTGATLTVEDAAQIGLVSIVQGAKLTATGGSIGNVDAIDQTEVVVDGGAIESLQIDVGSEGDLRAGSLGLVAVQSGAFRMSGGQLTEQLQINGPFSAARVSGGQVDGVLSAWAGGLLELVGESFTLDGLPINGLTAPGQSVLVGERNGALLSGSLADGSPIELVLNDAQFPGEEGVSLDSTLRLTLVPEPSAGLMLSLLLSIAAGRSTRA